MTIGGGQTLEAAKRDEHPAWMVAVLYQNQISSCTAVRRGKQETIQVAGIGAKIREQRLRHAAAT